MVEEIAKREPKTVLEIGCGTGKNLIDLKTLSPDVKCIGVDASVDMLQIARKKSHGLDIQWVKGRYPSEEVDQVFDSGSAPDIILFSYALSMFNPGFDQCLAEAHRHLAPGGVVCVVDFHETPFTWFRKWMRMNHVLMESQLLDTVKNLGSLVHYQEGKGLWGVWNYNVMISDPQG